MKPFLRQQLERYPVRLQELDFFLQQPEVAQAMERLRGWMEYDAVLVGELQAKGLVAGDLDVAAAITRLVATLNGAGMLWMLGVIDPSAYADLLNHAIDDELGLARPPRRVPA